MEERLGRLYAKGSAPSSAGSALNDPDFEGAYPHLLAFLCLDSYQGAPRRTGSLTLFVEEGKWKVAINDRHTGRGTFLSADTFESLLRSLDAIVASGGGEWRSKGAVPSQHGPRRGK